MNKSIQWEEPEKLKDLFVGKSVKRVDDEHLQLSDGTDSNGYYGTGFWLEVIPSVSRSGNGDE